MNLNLILNGEKTILTEDKKKLPQALEYFGYAEKFFAVAINHTFVPRSLYEQTELREGDIVDIVVPMQGG